MTTLREIPARRVATHCVCCGGCQLDSAPAILMPFVAHRIFGWEPVVIDDGWGLRTIPSGYACSVCRSLCCRKCGHLFLDIRFDTYEMEQLYAGYRDEAYTELRARYEPDYHRRNALFGTVSPYIPAVEAFLAPLVVTPPRVLDWGGGNGINTPFRGRCATHLVYDISGIAPVDGARSVLPADAATLSHDLVVCSNVLEHVPYPHEVLARISAVMSESTVLYVEVPFEDVMRGGSDAPHLRKRHWHEHVNFFSEHSLSFLLAGCGFTEISRSVLETEFDGRSVHLLQAACRLNPSS